MAISAFSVKFGVLTVLKTLMPTDADLVKLGLPVQDPPLNDYRRVYVMPVPPYQATPIFESGSQVRQANLVVPVLLEVEILTGNDVEGQEAAETDLATLVAQIEALCDADPSWGGVCFASGIALASEAAGPIADVQGGGGFLAHALLEVHCRTWGD
jgi:hypothetical protein